MAKYWFGSLELIGEQHDSGGHIMPTTLKPVKGWRVLAKDYPLVHRDKANDETRQLWIRDFLPKWLADWIPADKPTLTAMERDRNELAEAWWADAEVWWASQQVNKDLKGNVDDTRILDYQPIRETGDYQLRVAGPIEVPKENRPKEPLHTDKTDGRTLDKTGKTL